MNHAKKKHVLATQTFMNAVINKSMVLAQHSPLQIIASKYPYFYLQLTRFKRKG